MNIPPAGAYIPQLQIATDIFVILLGLLWFAYYSPYLIQKVRENVVLRLLDRQKSPPITSEKILDIRATAIVLAVGYLGSMLIMRCINPSLFFGLYLFPACVQIPLLSIRIVKSKNRGSELVKSEAFPQQQSNALNFASFLLSLVVLIGPLYMYNYLSNLGAKVTFTGSVLLFSSSTIWYLLMICLQLVVLYLFMYGLPKKALIYYWLITAVSYFIMIWRLSPFIGNYVPNVSPILLILTIAILFPLAIILICAVLAIPAFILKFRLPVILLFGLSITLLFYSKMRLF
jgi:hypothetical protein